MQQRGPPVGIIGINCLRSLLRSGGRKMQATEYYTNKETSHLVVESAYFGQGNTYCGHHITVVNNIFEFHDADTIGGRYDIKAMNLDTKDELHMLSAV
jgi:hypothetical protein